MRKRNGLLILAEFFEQKTESGTENTTRDRRVNSRVHAALALLVAKRDPNLRVYGFMPDESGNAKFCVAKPFGEYFVTDEYTHLAEYLRGAADALEAVQGRIGGSLGTGLESVPYHGQAPADV